MRLMRLYSAGRKYQVSQLPLIFSLHVRYIFAKVRLYFEPGAAPAKVANKQVGEAGKPKTACNQEVALSY